VHHEGERLEPQQQVLAPSTDLEQRLAVRSRRRRHSGLQRGEVEGDELAQHRPAKLLGQPFGVGLDLWYLGHVMS
jgi:hypothetical protein